MTIFVTKSESYSNYESENVDINVLCATALCISISILVAFIVTGVLLHKFDLRGKRAKRKYNLFRTPFRLAILGFFVAAVAMFYPIYYAAYLGTESESLRVVESVLLSIHNTLRLFVLDGEFDVVYGMLIGSATLSRSVRVIYTVYASLIYIVAPMLAAGVVLSFFKEASAIFRYTLHFRSDVYIISELNEQSIALAEDIITNNPNKERRVVVFADVYDKYEEEVYELTARAKKLGAICMRNDLNEIGLKPHSRKIHRKFYLIGVNEDVNIKQAIRLIERCRKVEKLNSPTTQIYVAANSTESEALLNSVDFGEIKVRRLNENRNLMLSTLLDCPIFENAVEVKGQKEISIVIVGLGAYGFEMLKALCWCGQLPGYVVRIHAFDKEPNCEAKVRSIAPELLKYNRMVMVGEPYYDLDFHGGIDVNSYEFLTELSSIERVTGAFVTLGNDELNIETAMKMRMQFGRDNIAAGKAIPPIWAVVYSTTKTQAAKQSGLKSIQGEDIGVGFLGDAASRYTLKSLECEDLEALGLKSHKHWIKRDKDGNPDPEENKAAEDKYNKYEYYRRASIAEVIYLIFRTRLIKDCDADTLMIYEHRRWSAFMRSEGYVYMPERSDIAKTHPSLIPYADLSEKEKAKDGIETEHDDQKNTQVYAKK